MTSPIDTAYVEIKPDTKKFTKDLKRNVDKSVGNAEKDANKAMQRIHGIITKALGGITKSVGTAASLFVKALTAVAGAAIKLTVVAGVVGAVSTAIAGLGAVVAHALPVIAQFVQVAITAAGAFAALPGVIGTLIAVVGTLKLAFSGVGDAIKAVVSGDVDKLDEALKNLAPNAAAFVKQIGKMQSAFKGLRLNVQQTFFKGFDKTLISLIRNTLPTLNTGLVGIARVLNQVLIVAFKQLDTVATRSQLSKFFAAAALTVKNLGVAFGPVINALLDVVSVGAQVISTLSGGVGTAVAEFAKHISDLAKTGELTKIITDGLGALKQFLKLGKDVIGIITGIFKASGAASGGGIFGFFERLNKLINSAAIQTALTSLFTTLGELGQILLPVLVALGQALVPVAKGIAEVAKAFAPQFVMLADSLGRALVALVPAIVALAPLIGALSGALIPVANAIARVVQGLAPAFVLFIDQLGKAVVLLEPGLIALGPAIAILGQSLAPLATILSNLVVGIGPGLTTFLGAFADALVNLLPAALPVGQALGDLLTALAPLLPLLGQLLTNALVPLAGVLSAASKAFGPFIKLFANAFAKELKIILPVLTTLVQELLPVFADLGQQVYDAFAPLIPVFLENARVLVSAIAPVIPKIVDAFRSLVPFLSSVAKVFGGALLQAFEAVAPFMPMLAQAAVDIALALVQMFVALVPLLPNFISLITLVVQLFTQTGFLQVVLTTFLGLVKIGTVAIQILTTVFRFLSNPIGTVIDLVKRFGEKFSNIGKAVKEKFQEVKDFFKALPGKIKGWIGDAGSILYETGKKVIKGFIQGILDMLPSLDDLFGHITLTIPQQKGPPEKDRKLLMPAGRSIIQGLMAGIRSTLPDLRRELAGVSADVGMSVAGNPTINNTVQFGAGSISNTFNGAQPTAQDALRIGQAVGAGITSRLSAQSVQSAVRSL